MRLLIDTKTETVIFAEASKPVVDFLLYMLCLPIGSVAKLVGNNGMVGSIGNVYQSVQDLNELCMQSEESKDFILKNASIYSDKFCYLLPTKDEHDISWFSSSGLSDFVLVDKLNIEDDEDDKEEDDEDYYYVEDGDEYDNEEQANNNEDGDCDEEGYGYEDGDEYDNEEHANNNEDGDCEEEGYGYEDGDEYDNEEQANNNEDGDCEEEGYGNEHGEKGEDYDYEEHAYYNEDGDDGDYYDNYKEEKEFRGVDRDYQCPNNYCYNVTTIKTPICYQCNTPMEDITDYCEFNTEDIAEAIGFVKDNVTFLVMDDLVIQPITSMIEIVNKFNVKETREMIVELGMNEGIKLLKASLESKMVLTRVFLNKD